MVFHVKTLEKLHIAFVFWEPVYMYQ